MGDNIMQEYQAFLKWFGSQYGAIAKTTISPTNFQNSPYYTYWVSAGRPLQGTPTGQPSWWKTPVSVGGVGAVTQKQPSTDQTIMSLFGGGGLGAGGEEMSQVGPANINPTGQAYSNWMGQNYSPTGQYIGTSDTSGATTSPQGQSQLQKYRGMKSTGVVGVENLGGYNFTVMINTETGEPFFSDNLGEVKTPAEVRPGMTAQESYDIIAMQRQAQGQKEQAQQQAAQLARESQLADLAAQRQKDLAQLASQPQSWLEYSALAGQAPAVQPWMVPLYQQPQGDIKAMGLGGEAGDEPITLANLGAYPSTVEAGQAIPGYGSSYVGGNLNATVYPNWSNQFMYGPTARAQGSQLPSQTQNWKGPGTPNYSMLPQLTMPSEQYWAGMGPDLQNQYYAYQQARTGATPEQTYWGMPWNITNRAKEAALKVQTEADTAEAARKKAFAAWMPSGGMNLTYRR